MTPWLNAIMGGSLIGLAAVFTMLVLGRISGISGIARGFVFGGDERAWRAAFVIGLVCAAPLFALVSGRSGISTPHTSLLVLGVAGFLVGIGTALGGGCTSGHGVCGFARLSLRSIVATLTFMLAAIVTVALVRHVLSVPV